MRLPPPTVLIDDREQIPFVFPWPTRTVSLRTGDYTIAGLEDVFTIERKSPQDFAATLLHRWVAFSRQLDRMARMDLHWTCIVVTDSPAQIIRDRCKTGRERAMIISRTREISTRWRINCHFAGDYACGNVYTKQMIWDVWKGLRKRDKKG